MIVSKKPLIAILVAASTFAPTMDPQPVSDGTSNTESSVKIASSRKCGRYPNVAAKRDCWVVKNEQLARKWRRTRVAKCIRHYESGHNYKAVSPRGSFRGAYQFKQSTFDSLGPNRLDGIRANKAPKFLQDLKARRLWKERGLSPWPTPRRRCN